MTSTLRLAVLVLGLVLGFAASSQAQGERLLTTTLLPVQIKATAGPDGLLWIRQGAENAVKPDRDVFLLFDLSGLPPGLTDAAIKTATLRLVAQNVVYQPANDNDTGGTLVSVKGQVAKPDLSSFEGTASVVALSSLTTNNAIARQTPEELRKAVAGKYAADKRLALRLFSESHKASTLLYSTAGPRGFGDSQSNMPRLVIQYTLGSPPLLESAGWSQLQRGPEHTGRSAWTPSEPPTGYTLSRIEIPKLLGQAGSVADYPLIYRGNVYVVYKVLEVNRLLALDFKGNEILWQGEIKKGTVQRSPVISRDGRFYVVTEASIDSYDLNASGKLLHSYPLTGKVSDYTDLTMGNDGSLFVAVKENDTNAIYGFTPDLKPFLKSEPFAKGRDKVSTPTVSADGQRVFTQFPGGAAIIDVTNPTRAQVVKLVSGSDVPWEYYHAPVAGPAGNIMVYTDFTSTAKKGNVWGISPDQGVWSSAGTVPPQPVLGSNGIVYFVDGGAFRGHPYDQVGSTTVDTKDGLGATSNMVIDGANNSYFWDNGTLRGYNAKGEKLFASDFTGLDKARTADPEDVSGTKATRVSSGPEQFIRLMLGPDGTLWANNRSGDSLYAFRPSFANANASLTQKLQDQTIYRATGTLTVGTPPVTAGTRVLLQGGSGIVLPRGFAVDKGATLLLRTGF